MSPEDRAEPGQPFHLRHAEEQPEAASRGTQSGGACFETPAARAPQHDDGGSGPFTPRVSNDIGDLLAIMAALRTPGSGCAWDLEQSFRTIARYTVEEAYEVADAVARDDLEDLCEELGDLLLQVVFHARMAEEIGAFAFADVVRAITAKLIRRHPHVFGEARDLSAAAVKALWDSIKADEKRERAARRGVTEREAGLLAKVPRGLPALARADGLSRRAAAVGFVWAEAADVLAKIDEEVAEAREAVAAGDEAAIEAEIGDLLFTVANLARHFDIDPEEALAGTNRKFERRFGSMEEALAGQGRNAAEASLDELEALWVEAKDAERAGG